MKNNKNKKKENSLNFIYILLIASFLLVAFNSIFWDKSNDPLNIQKSIDHYFYSKNNSSTDVESNNKTAKDIFQKGRDIYSFVAKHKNKIPVLSVNSFDHLGKIVYYNKDGYIDLVPEKIYADDIDDKEKDVLKFLSDKQEDFDQESKKVLEEFQQADPKTKISLLSTERGKAHLIYRYIGDPGYDIWLNGTYLVLKIYYNPNSEADNETLETSINSLLKYAKDNGNILYLDLIDVNKENPVVLEDVRYSGDIIAVAYPVKVTDKYGMFYHKEDQHQISLTKNPDHIVDLMDYFKKLEFNDFIRKNANLKTQD